MPARAAHISASKIGVGEERDLENSLCPKCQQLFVLFVSIRFLGGTLDGVIRKGSILLRLPACNLDFSGVPRGEKISGSQPRVCNSSSSSKDTSKNLGKRQNINRIAITGLALCLVGLALCLVGLAHAHQWSPTRLDNLSLHVISFIKMY